jgi:hypothetical protein
MTVLLPPVGVARVGDRRCPAPARSGILMEPKAERKSAPRAGVGWHASIRGLRGEIGPALICGRPMEREYRSLAGRVALSRELTVRTNTGRRIAVIVAITAAGLSGAAQVQQIPVPPIHTAFAPMPGVNALPLREEMPDVMVTDEGRRVTSAAQWKQRREEMKRVLAYYAVGSVPPPPGNVMGRELGSRLVLGGKVKYRLVHLSFGPRSELGFDVAVFTPADARPPFPTVIYPTFGPTPGATPLPTMARPPEQGRGLDALTIPLGDQTARAAAAAVANPTPSPAGLTAFKSTQDPEQAASASGELFRRGYALVTYHYEDAGEDTIGRNTDGSWAFRNTRFFPAYPHHDWGLLASWAWGISRVVDYLQARPEVDGSKLIAVGHSRIGKAVLVAGAFDERLSLVAPAGSGAGGTGAYRFNGAAHGGREGLDDMMRKYPNWFSPHLHEFAGQVARLPFDQHWLIALAAPRAFLSLEGTDDQNCVPNAVRQAFAGAEPAFALLKAGARLGVNFANHRHALTPDDWTALLDFSDQQLRGMAVARRFDQFPPEPPPGQAGLPSLASIKVRDTRTAGTR